MLLWYTDDDVWHEALVALIVNDEDAYIYTPDGDLYVEKLTCKGVTGPARLKGLPASHRLPSTLGAAAYRFRERITDDVLKRVIRDAFIDAEKEGLHPVKPDVVCDASGKLVGLDEFYGGSFLRRRLTRTDLSPILPAASMAPKEARAVTPALADYVWLAAEPLGGLVLGQEVSLSAASDVQVGDRCALALRQGSWVKVEMIRQEDAPGYAEKRRLLFGSPLVADAAKDTTPVAVGKPSKPGEEEPDDDKEVRTLWVDFDEHGDRFKRWRDVCQESFTPTFSETPLEGPSTALHLIKHTERQGGDPRLWLQLWLRSKHIEQTDRTYHEMKVLVDTLYYAGTYDQVNIPALVSLEVVCRRLQAIVDAYTNPSRPSWENAKIYAGQGGPDDVISPSFRSYAAKKNKDELELMQARQKVRELRNAPLNQADEGDGTDALPKQPKPTPKRRGKGAQAQGDGQ